MVGDSQFDMWIVVVKDFEFVQEKETQGDFAGSDIYQSAFESFVFEKFVFSGHKLFNGDGNVFITESRYMWRQCAYSRRNANFKRVCGLF